MRNNRTSEPGGASQVRDALDHIEEVVVDGLRHGFFQCTIKGEVVKDKKRVLLIEAGKSEKFTIRNEEIPR